jgi:hypothetical protein
MNNILIYKEHEETYKNEDGKEVCLYTKATSYTFEHIANCIREETGVYPKPLNHRYKGWLIEVEDTRVLVLNDGALKDIRKIWEENSCA